MKPFNANHNAPGLAAAVGDLARRAFEGVTAQWVLLYVALQAVGAFQSPGIWETIAEGRDAASALRSYCLHFSWSVLWHTPPLIAAIAAVNLGSQDVSRMICRTAVAIVAGVAIGRLLGEAVLRPFFPGYEPLSTSLLVTGSLAALLRATLCAGLYIFLRRGLRAAQSLRDEELTKVASARTLAQGRLSLMQAQIEPHFLFNSLANVRRLCQLDPVRGRAMVRNLGHYLEATLPQMRDAHSTLGRELAMAEAYLVIQKIRMDERLRWTIDLDERLRSLSFPPLVLVTLVENAIKHGLAPLPEGGSISIEARKSHDGVTLRVVDSGKGLSAVSGTGLGLANIRARLAALYGRRDLVRLEQNSTGGVTATVTIPDTAATTVLVPATA